MFTLASIACGLAPSLDVLNVARGVQGVAAATANVTSLALVSAAFPDPKQKARAIGIWTAIASVGHARSARRSAACWSSTWDGAPSSSSTCRSGVLVVFLTLRYVRESRDERPRTLDAPGQALFMVTVGRARVRRDRGAARRAGRRL